MSDNIIQLNEQVIKTEIKDLVRNSFEETFNALLNQEATIYSMRPSTNVRRSVKAIEQDITHVVRLQLRAMLL